METMQGILIDPSRRRVEAVDVLKDTYKRIPEMLGCRLMTRVGVSEASDGSGRGDDLWLDDEGLLTDPNPYGYFRLRSVDGQRVTPGVYAGRGLILAHDGEGESVGTALTVGDVFPTVEWLSYEQLTYDELHPMATFQALDENFQPVGEPQPLGRC